MDIVPVIVGGVEVVVSNAVQKYCWEDASLARLNSPIERSQSPHDDTALMKYAGSEQRHWRKAVWFWFDEPG